ncbi:MAG: excinuclease ABC subunit A [Bacteroidetes bacterium]|nr:MAG: excinuclease ABC subunit A [Bacteroidota bacterium]
MISIQGARENNLQNIDIDIPRNQLVVITGLSGSGKSSLAFDTIYAEGQRRYIESFSAYVRQFLGGSERPDVDKITGLCPVISIEQKTTSKNPRSTVGTITEIYDFLRLLYARASDAYSYNTGEKMVRYNNQQMVELIAERFSGQKISILAPVVKGRKGNYKELLQQILRKGFLKARIDGEITEIKYGLKLDRYKMHDIEILIDQVDIKKSSQKRLLDSLGTALSQSNGTIIILPEVPTDSDDNATYLSKYLMCPTTGISYPEPEPNSFSFNSPYGACTSCSGTGKIAEISEDKIIPNKKLSIENGAISPIGKYKGTWIFKQLEAIGDKYDFELSTPFENISDEATRVILTGSDEIFKIKNTSGGGGDSRHLSTDYTLSFEGIINFLTTQYKQAPTPSIKKWITGFMNKKECPQCKGARLKKESLYFKIGSKNIAELASMDVSSLHEWTHNIKNDLNKKQKQIASEILKELNTRLEFLLDIGLGYLSLNRNAKDLSGGESQRIRLATQIGSQLVGVLYILDEPSIGLHQRDNAKLVDSLKNLRDSGNSVIVVEHDHQMILAADHVIDIGPGAGLQGGFVVAQGKPTDLKNTLTADYLTGARQIEIPRNRREGNGKYLSITGARGNNLKNLDVQFPLGKMICLTGVSGSGKSSLLNETIYPILNQYFYRSISNPLAYNEIKGLEHIDKVIEIDQSPIGRTPRSNPATYTGAFTDIRNLFANLPEAKIRGYKVGRFSFNVKGGRCETCGGAGMRTIEMNFLPDVYVNCETCNGNRYNRETLQVRFKGKSISEVLNMTIDQAVDFFKSIPSITQKIKTLKDVGLGYIGLGQPSTTLSGGEAQRVKLATELSKRSTGNTFYILDEPTTGLHFEDVRVLLNVLNKLVDKGNTVVIIEHNMDIIKSADHIIDLGPEGGALGGSLVVEGPPETVAKDLDGYTGEFLKQELKNN